MSHSISQSFTRLAAILSMAAAFFAPQTGESAFNLLDDFETLPLGSVTDDPFSPWTGHAGSTLTHVLEEAGNRFLGVGWSSNPRGGSRPLPFGMEINAGDQATLFLQFRPGTLAPLSTQGAYFGLTHNVDTSSNSPESDIRVGVRVTPGPTSTELNLEVRDGAAWHALTPLNANSWLNLWFVINRSGGGDTFSIYMTNGVSPAGGTDPLAYLEGDQSVSVFSFRDSGSPSDVLNGFAAYAHATASLNMHFDNLWMDNTGENLAFMGLDLDAWQFAHVPQNAPFSLNFGMAGGDDDGGSLVRPRPQDLELQWDSLRLAPTSESLMASAAVAVVENYEERRDFTLETDMTLRQFGDVGAHRVGLVVLGNEHVPLSAPFNPASNTAFYGLVWLPAVDAETSRIQIRQGFSGSILAEAVWGGLHPSLDNLGQGGIGLVYNLRADGVFDASGLLNLSFTLTDPNNYSQVISTQIFQPRHGNSFGFGAYASNAIFPQFDFHDLSMSMGGDPVEITDPAIQWPFAYAFGTAEGRDDNGDFSQNEPGDWSLEESALRLSTARADYHSSVNAAWVFNYDPGVSFGLNLNFTLAGLEAGVSDTRVGMVFMGDEDRDVFDPANDQTYYSFQWIPNAAAGSSLVVRQGMNGQVYAQADLADLPEPPVLAVGTVYHLEFNGFYKQNGNLVFVALLSDGNGGEAELLGEIENPAAGGRFGFGAWHRAADNPVWDFHAFSMGAPNPGLGAVAPFVRNDNVGGFALQPQWIGYNINSGVGIVGSEGGATTRRHFNPVMGFELPVVSRDKIVRFDLTVHRAPGRDDHSAHLYGLLPEDPSTYSDGSITPDADGVDVWWQGPVLDERPDLVGAAWSHFITRGAADDAPFSVDVTDFISSFYDEDGPTQSMVFFRLSPSVTVGVSNLGRVNVQNGKGLPTSPRLSYVTFPPEAPDTFVEFPFHFAFGTGEGRQGLEDFARNLPSEWTLADNSARLTTDNPELHPSLNHTRVVQLGADENFGLGAKMTLGNLAGAPGESRVGLLLFGEGARADFDVGGPDTYFTFQWIPNPASGPSIAVRRGMDGEVIAQSDFSGLANPPQTVVGRTYTLQFHALHQAGGDVNFKAILRDGAGGEATLAGTIEGLPEGRNRFGFGALHTSEQSPVWDFHEFTMIDAWKVSYEGLEAPFAFDFGTAEGKDDLSPLLRSLPVELTLLEDAVRFKALGSTWTSNAAVAEVVNYHRRQDFTLESEFTLNSLNVENPTFLRIGFAVLGAKHEPFDAPFNVTAEADNFYGMSWFPSGSLRIRHGFNGPQIIQENIAIPIVVGEKYRMKAEGEFQPDGSVVLTFTLTDPFDAVHSVSTTVENPLHGPMFGFGGRAFLESGQAETDYHTFALSLGEVPEPFGPTFEDWRNQNFTAAQLEDPAISGPLAAPAGDNVSNLRKYAAGLDAFTPATGGDFSAAAFEDGEFLFTYRELRDALDLDYIVHVSDDLIDWDPAGLEEISRVDAGDGVDLVTVKVSLPDPAAAKAFARLEVTLK